MGSNPEPSPIKLLPIAGTVAENAATSRLTTSFVTLNRAGALKFAARQAFCQPKTNTLTTAIRTAAKEACRSGGEWRHELRTPDDSRAAVPVAGSRKVVLLMCSYLFR